jgi:hypothetical protein
MSSPKMDPFGNDEIARLLRLKRYEQPPPAYFENFLHEFRRRQRDELLSSTGVAHLFEARTRFRAPAQCPSLPCGRRGSGGVRRSDFNQDFVPLKLEWESLDDQPLLEK